MQIQTQTSLQPLLDQGLTVGELRPTSDGQIHPVIFDQQLNAVDLTTANDFVTVTDLDATKFFQQHQQQNYPFQIIDAHTIDVNAFIEVRGKTDFSMNDSMAQIPAIVANSAVAAGINDHGVGYGLYEFNQQMLAAHKKPILGAELYLKKTEKSRTYQHLVVLVKSLAGYRNLAKLLSLAASRLTVEDDSDAKTRPWNLLSDFDTVDCADFICLHGYQYSELNNLINKDKTDKAVAYLQQLVNIFGQDDTYVEIQYHDLAGEDDLNDALQSVAQTVGVKCVLTNDYHMIAPDDAKTLEILQAIGMKQQVGHHNWHLEGENWYFHQNYEIEPQLAHNSSLVAMTDTTIEIYNKCQWYNLYVKENYMPEFKLPQGFHTQNEYFEFLAHKGLNVRLHGKITPEYEKQLQHEIDIIEQMGFAGYFLIVADFINYAKRNYKAYDEETAQRWQKFIADNHFDPAPIAIGPARGSAAGSLVAYSMYITEVDPMPYDLLFERFLNPERVSMPDIDTDIPDNKRAEIIEYVQNYYNGGNCAPLDSRVAGIAVFGTLKIKGGIKAVVRGLYKNPQYGAQLANAIPDTVETKEDLDNLIGNNELPTKNGHFDVDKILGYVRDLLGCATNLSQHAAGYVITPEPVINYLPTTFALSNKTGKMEMLTAYTGVEANGLLKMDFLGLKAMTIINDAINDINAKERQQLTFEKILQEAPYDHELYVALSEGQTGDVFQLASQGMTDVIRKCLGDVDANDPASLQRAKQRVYFDRLIAGIAMYRPGPKQFIPDFIKNALYPESITYSVPEMKSVLDSSFGLLIYQESIMALLRQVAGFTLGGADVARRIMGHKKPEELPALKQMYLHGNGKDIPGGLALGHSEEELNKLWDDIEKFASYGFNKSHATGYAHISIVMTYLAHYYPAYFGVSNLNHAANTDDIKNFIRIYRQRSIKVLPPSINQSANDFTVFDDAILFGLGGIKQVATKAGAIFNERELRGQFANLYDFLARMARYQKQKPLTKSSLQGLIYSGALDEFTGSRKSKIDHVETMAALLSLLKKEAHIIFDDTTEEYFNQFLDLDDAEFELEDQLKFEHDFTGFYISGHPTDIYRQAFDLGSSKKIHLKELKETIKEDERFHLLGVVTDIHKHITKTNEIMAFVTLEDDTDTLDVIAFPDCYQNFGRYFKVGQTLFVDGYTDRVGDHGMPFIVTSAMAAMERIPARDIVYYQLTLDDISAENGDKLNQLFKISNKNLTDCEKPLKVFVKSANHGHGKTYTNRQGAPMMLSYDSETIGAAQQLFGKQNLTAIWTIDGEYGDSTTDVEAATGLI